MSMISGTSAQTYATHIKAFNTVSGRANALQEVGQQTGDEVTLSAGSAEDALALLRTTIHTAGTNNPFFAGDSTQPPSAPANLLTGCKVYKTVGGGVTKYWRTYLFQKDNHGYSVDTGSTLSNLLNTGVTSNYDIDMAATNAVFVEPLRVIAKPTASVCRVNIGQSRGAYSALAPFGGGGTLSDGTFHGILDIIVDSTTDVPEVGDEIVAPPGVGGELSNAGFSEAAMYYVLDEDHIVIYTDRCLANSSVSPTNLTDATIKTWQALGKASGDNGGTDQFSSSVGMNARSFALTTSYQSQIIPSGVRMIEFWCGAGDTTIQLGKYKTLLGSSGHGPGYVIASTTIIVPENTKTKVPINTSLICGFQAKASAGTPDLHWNYIVG